MVERIAGATKRFRGAIQIVFIIVPRARVKVAAEETFAINNDMNKTATTVCFDTVGGERSLKTLMSPEGERTTVVFTRRNLR